MLSLPPHDLGTSVLNHAEASSAWHFWFTKKVLGKLRSQWWWRWRVGRRRSQKFHFCSRFFYRSLCRYPKINGGCRLRNGSKVRKWHQLQREKKFDRWWREAGNHRLHPIQRCWFGRRSKRHTTKLRGRKNKAKRRLRGVKSKWRKKCSSDKFVNEERLGVFFLTFFWRFLEEDGTWISVGI